MKALTCRFSSSWLNDGSRSGQGTRRPFALQTSWTSSFFESVVMLFSSFIVGLRRTCESHRQWHRTPLRWRFSSHQRRFSLPILQYPIADHLSTLHIPTTDHSPTLSPSKFASSTRWLFVSHSSSSTFQPTLRIPYWRPFTFPLFTDSTHVSSSLSNSTHLIFIFIFNIRFVWFSFLLIHKWTYFRYPLDFFFQPMYEVCLFFSIFILIYLYFFGLFIFLIFILVCLYFFSIVLW